MRFAENLLPEGFSIYCEKRHDLVNTNTYYVIVPNWLCQNRNENDEEVHVRLEFLVILILGVCLMFLRLSIIGKCFNYLNFVLSKNNS